MGAFLFANDLPYTHTRKDMHVCVHVHKQLSHVHTRSTCTHSHKHIVAHNRAHSHNDDTYLILFFQSRLRIICEFSAFIVIQLYRNQFEFVLEFKVDGNAVSFIYKMYEKTAQSKAEKNKKKIIIIK